MVKSKVLAELKAIQQRCADTSGIETEEATKHSLILPLISALGYGIFDNNEVRPEYIADVGTKKGEKVDYVILQNGQPMILIEAKQVGTPLKNKVDQLFRYFSVTSAKIAILTDGVKYLFFTDSQKANIMDTAPYMTIDLKVATDEEIARLMAYHKEQINIGTVIDNIKYDQFTEVAKEFVDNLLEMRPNNWLIRKLAEYCQIAEPDDVKLAELLNKQLEIKLNSKKTKKVSAAKIIKGDVEETKQLIDGVGKLADEEFKDTKGIRIVNVDINGATAELDSLSWRKLFIYIFTKSIEAYDVEEILKKFNKDDTRKYVYNNECKEEIKKDCYYIEEKDIYVYVRLAGKDLVYRAIEACDIFGVIDKDSVEIQYTADK